jgi:hypothetical protein
VTSAPTRAQVRFDNCSASLLVCNEVFDEGPDDHGHAPLPGPRQGGP